MNVWQGNMDKIIKRLYKPRNKILPHLLVKL